MPLLIGDCEDVDDPETERRRPTEHEVTQELEERKRHIAHMKAQGLDENGCKMQ